MGAHAGQEGDDVAEPDPIQVMIVDDQPAVRSGLGAFLLAFDDLELAGEASSGGEAIRLCAACQPDVILMDLVMAPMDGPATIRAIRERHPRVQIIALTSFPEQDLVEAALQAGAIGYLLKNVTADELAGAIRAARAGRPTLSPEATKALLASGRDLSDAERALVALLVQGPSNLDIDERLLACDGEEPAFPGELAYLSTP